MPVVFGGGITTREKERKKANIEDNKINIENRMVHKTKTNLSLILGCTKHTCTYIPRLPIPKPHLDIIHGNFKLKIPNFSLFKQQVMACSSKHM